MPKPRACREPGCPFPCVPRKRSCSWHWIATRPIAEQLEAAARRLARTPEAERRARVPAAEWPDGGRWCSGCQSFIPNFYVSGSRCRACASKASHAGATKKKYGIDGDEYDRLLKLQGGRCAICRCLPRTVRLAVDHDHATGAVRGLCCSSCNHDLLGAAHDDVEILRRAVAYLEAPPASGRWVGAA